jgi:outer membrane receptor protein involved in Fe transport
VSPFFAETIPAFFGVNSFKGLREYRGRQEANNYAGDHILNMAVGYKPIEKLKIAFIVKNVMNWEWMPRPGRFEAPRSYTLQLTYQFF